MALWAISSSLFAQNILYIPYGTTPTIDGSITTGEWDESDTVSISIMGGSREVLVLYKHDSLNLYLAYLGNLASSNIRFPEAMLDINHDQSVDWMSDDWWFHVSATDCESVGQPSNYDSCQLIRHNWTGVPNFVPAAPNVDTVEIQIPFNTINLDITIVDTIGIALDVSNTFSVWEYWPGTADVSSPATWGKAVFLHPAATSIQKPLRPNPLTIAPNPNQGTFSIAIPQSLQGREMQIKVLDRFGKNVYVAQMGRQNSSATHAVSVKLPGGIYVVEVRSGTAVFWGKVMVK